MSGYPGQYGGYQGGPPPQQQYAPPGGYYPPPQQGYNGYPPAGSGYGYQQPSPQPYGYNQPPPPQQYGGYQQPPQPNYNGRPGVPTANSNAYMHGNHNAPPPPPSAPQQFGHGAPNGYAFQYSNCTGRRKALLIGINYFGQRGQLRGCINDVKNMSAYLVDRFGYKREDMVILTDDQQNPMSQPTKQNLLRAMHWLVKDARPNDSLFFHYSGHGGQTKDLDGDEPDGYDEVIYPVDFRQTGHITDDEMHRIMVKPLQAGVRLTAIFDSCHSGTALDLPYIYSTQGILKEPNLAKEAGQGLLGVISSYSQGDLGGVASNIMGFFKKATTGEDAYNRTMATKTSPADVVMLSGSKDDQTSADATIAAQATGAMSWAFITALKKNPQQSYVQLLNSIRDELSTRYTQKPQLSCSHPLSMSSHFGCHFFEIMSLTLQIPISYSSCKYTF
ncbi:Metacaspase-1, partial [Colletotrichum shisoi]